MISPSKIAISGLKGFVKPAIGSPALEKTTCSACAATIAEGEPVIVWQPNRSTFTDFQYLASRSERVCAYCAPFFENRALLKTQKCVINEHGAWSLSKDAHRAWFLTTPPAPPFVAVVSDAQKQHLIWRAAVTLDRDLLRIQVGRSAISIDRPLLLEAVEWSSRAVTIAREAGLRVTPNHPFERLDRDLSDFDHGALRWDIVNLSHQNEELRGLLAKLVTLGEGEFWGLAVLAKAKQETPLEEPLTLT